MDALCGLLVWFPGLLTVAVGAFADWSSIFHAVRFVFEHLLGHLIVTKILTFKRQFNFKMTDILVISIVGAPLVIVE